MVSKSFSSLVLGLGIAVPFTGSLLSSACSSKFEGCEASRTCGSGGEGGEGATGVNGGNGGSSGRGGSSAGKGGGGTTAAGGQGGETDGAGAVGNGGAAGGSGGKRGANSEPMGGEGGTEAEPEPDTTRPEVVSISPDDGEPGITADTVIRITFSEPMDRTTTELAYQSPDIPFAVTTRHWSPDDTVLTVTPNAPLSYAEGTGTDLTFPALTYALEMTDTAEDKAGNRLVPRKWSFTTLRRVSQKIAATGDNSRRINMGANLPCTDAMQVGDDENNEPLLGLVQFDLNELLPGSRVFESAALRTQRIPEGSGDPRALDGVRVTEFDADISEVDLFTPVGPELGILVDSYGDYPQLDVLPAMTSDYASDGLIQFRLKLAPTTDGDDVGDYYALVCALELRLVYLAP